MNEYRDVFLRTGGGTEISSDLSNIVIVANATSEEQLKNVTQECEYLKEQCEIQ